ncbi:MAG: HDOD domain-containing protein [Thioalkalispiraceae bacterium]|jgi:HD-like signal output (HDOD) protein
MEQPDNPIIGLEEWTRRISEEEMPVFAHTARSIAAASSEEETSIANLAHLILRDSSMTARVLRLANSVFFNPSGQPINTISRAIVLLGFDSVRSMALSIALLEPLLKGVQHDHALEEMARSFHAAVQARSLAQQRGSSEPEAVFVAALLARLGKMAFWCFPYGRANQMDEAYRNWDNSDKAEKSVLGFTLKQLSCSLNEEWSLSSLLTNYLTGNNQESQAVMELEYADNLILSVEDGWGGIKTSECIKNIAEHLDLSIDEVKQLVQKNAHEAAITAKEYGAEAAIKYIPLPVDGQEEEVAAFATPHVADQTLQMDILRELTTMLHEKADLNAILGTISEGIYRALGMERTIISFVSPQDNLLCAKYTLGDDKDRFKNCFAISLNEKNIFSAILKNRSAFWLNDQTRKNSLPLITQPIKRCLDVLEFFAMPIWVNNQGRGLIYADCKRSGRKLSMQEFQTFTHFSEYASIAFDLLATQSRKK